MLLQHYISHEKTVQIKTQIKPNRKTQKLLVYRHKTSNAAINQTGSMSIITQWLSGNEIGSKIVVSFCEIIRYRMYENTLELNNILKEPISFNFTIRIFYSSRF